VTRLECTCRSYQFITVLCSSGSGRRERPCCQGSTPVIGPKHTCCRPRSTPPHTHTHHHSHRRSHIHCLWIQWPLPLRPLPLPGARGGTDRRSDGNSCCITRGVSAWRSRVYEQAHFIYDTLQVLHRFRILFLYLLSRLQYSCNHHSTTEKHIILEARC
jgi:hypothetical protein